MKDRKDETVIELTEVVEEGPAESGWMDTAPSPPELKSPEPPRPLKRENLRALDDLKAIPESPLKKFLVAEEEAAAAVPPPSPVPELSSSAAQATSQPPRIPPEQPRSHAESPRPVPAPAANAVPEHVARPVVPDVEAEMRSMREAMLARVEAWVAQEGPRIMERVARDIFPQIAEKVIREEIEKLKSAEEKD
ncbi:MAG TPA: hypothetical protein VLS90_03855 [Thermodesulfobacteriota bacterium]|nr:hypothetical protein [Thermodesulfobacteriota bacterium]